MGDHDTINIFDLYLANKHSWLHNIYPVCLIWLCSECIVVDDLADNNTKSITINLVHKYTLHGYVPCVLSAWCSLHGCIDYCYLHVCIWASSYMQSCKYCIIAIYIQCARGLCNHHRGISTLSYIVLFILLPSIPKIDSHEFLLINKPKNKAPGKQT